MRRCSPLTPSTLSFIAAVAAGAVSDWRQEDKDFAAIILSLHDVWHRNITAILTSCMCETMHVK